MRTKTLANKRLAALDLDVKPRPLGNVLAGIILRSAIPVMVLVAFLLFALLSSSGLGILGPVLIFLTVLLGIRTFRISSRFLVNPRGKLQFDARPPVLYLRSFFDDYEEIDERVDKNTPEQILAPILDMVGPVIAIGRPGEATLPLLGATRVYPKDWQNAVTSIISISPLVVLHAGTSPGVEWELQATRRMIAPEKLIITLLVWQTRQGTPTILDLPDWSYRHFAKRFAEVFGHDLPPYNSNTSFIYFEKDWTPRTIELTRQVSFLAKRLAFFTTPTATISSQTIANAVLHLLRERGLINPSGQPRPRMYWFWLFFSLRGRLSRKSFWLKGMLPLVAFFVIVTSLLSDKGGPEHSFMLEWTMFFVGLLWIPLTAKRVHDFDVSGWLGLITVFPCLGYLIPIAFGAIPGTPGPNRFGARGF